MSPDTRTPERPFSRYAKVMGVGLLAGVVAGAVTALVGIFSPEGGWLSAVVVAATATLAMFFALWASVHWWKGLDEAAQEAHKWAWWWGGTIGLAIAGVIILTLVYGVGDLGQGMTQDILLIGAAIVAVCQLLGYCVAWVIWWLKRR